MDEVIISNGDSPLISQPSPVLVGGEPSVVVQENFVGGQNSTIQIGSVETLPAGSQAYVNNVGTATHAVLDFGIVTGNTGASGSNGIDGADGRSATIQVGTVTTGLPDTNVIITNVGTENAAILDFTIPRGSQGDQGVQGVAGVDGISPIAYVEQIAGGARVVIEDSENTTTANIMDGTDGVDGFSPIATVTPTASGATVSITDAQGTTTANITNGTNGTDGTDGFSPIASVTQTSGGATISITDSQGTTTANITNGVDGTDGTDGFSPIATVTPTASGATVSITDSQGTTTANITNGTNGHDGTSATVSVGTTTTLPAGSSATVTNSGTSSAAVFNFGIPKGSDADMSGEVVSLSSYITASSGYTFTDNGCRRFGKLVVLNFSVSGTIGTGETNCGTCTNNIICDVIGAGKTAAWNQTNRPASVFLIKNGSVRIYSVANNTAAEFTAVVIES